MSIDTASVFLCNNKSMLMQSTWATYARNLNTFSALDQRWKTYVDG
jgi:hypothetical protein